VPIVVGVATLFILEPANRPRGAGLVGQILRGYPLSAAQAVTLVILAGVGIARFLHHKAIGWSDAHVAIVVRPGGYDQVVADLEAALDDAGLPVDRRPAPLPLAIPGRILGRIAGPAMRSLVPDRPVELVGPGIEIGLYPSDIAIAGKKLPVAQARAAIATRLTSTAASMTTSAEAQEVEAELEAMARPSQAGGEPGSDRPVDLEAASRSFADLDRRLATLDVPHEEWEILYRQRLQVERDLLAGRAPGSVQPSEAGSPLGVSLDRAAAADAGGSPARVLSPPAAAAVFLLIALDVLLAPVHRPRRRS
jgi:hypothetical protein